MFAVKSMDVNSNLLKLKLDMVYRDILIEEAQKRFGELVATEPEPPAPGPAAPVPVRKRIKVKTAPKGNKK
jgi:hypothetical protein